MEKACGWASVLWAVAVVAVAQRCLHYGRHDGEDSRHDGWRYRLFVILTTYKFLTLGKKQANLYLLSLYRHFNLSKLKIYKDYR